MEVADHLRTSLEFLEVSELEFAAGAVMQASEKLWGAASQIIIAAAKERDWPHTSHPSLKAAAGWLAEEYGDQAIAADFALSEKFHKNFYHNLMEDYEIAESRPIVRQFVQRMHQRLTAAGPGVS